MPFVAAAEYTASMLDVRHWLQGGMTLAGAGVCKASTVAVWQWREVVGAAECTVAAWQ